MCLAGSLGSSTKLASSLAFACNKTDILNSAGHPFVSFSIFSNPTKKVGCYLLDPIKVTFAILFIKNKNKIVEFGRTKYTVGPGCAEAVQVAWNRW